MSSSMSPVVVWSSGRPGVGAGVLGALVVVAVEAEARLAAQLAALDELGDGAAGQVAWVVAGRVAGELGVVADVDAGEVHQLERTHRIAQRGAAGGVDGLDGGDPVLEQEDRLVT